MPNKYEPLTKKEKDEIIKRNKQIVDEMNVYLTDEDDKKIDYINPDTLDNPSTVASYRIAQEVKALKEKQQEQYNTLFSNVNLRNPDDEKWLVHVVKGEDTPQARMYNQTVLKDYQENPDKLKAYLFKKVTTFNPVKLMTMKDDKSKMLEFYLNNHEVVDLANVLSEPGNESIIADQGEEFKKAIKEISEPLSVIGYPAKIAKDALNVDYYAMPELDANQNHWVVVRAERNNKEFAPYVRDMLEEKEGNDITRRPSEYFNKIKDVCHIKMNNEFISRWHAIETHQDEVDIADFSDVVKNRNEDLDYIAKKDSEFNKVRFVNKYYMDKYSEAWKETFQNIRKDNKPYDFARIKDQHKGGWFERWRGTTSKEYTRFIDALGEYNDPKSEHYLDKSYLKLKGDMYLKHKFKNKEIDLTKSSGTSLKRAKLVNDTIATISQEKFIEANIDREISRGYPIEQNSFLKANDVEEIAPERQKIKEHGKEYDIEADIEFNRIEL